MHTNPTLFNGKNDVMVLGVLISDPFEIGLPLANKVVKPTVVIRHHAIPVAH